MRVWSRANPDKVKATSVKRYIKNRTQDNLRSKLWRLKNLEKVKAFWKDFHERNAGKEKEWNRKKRVKNRVKNRETQKRYHAERPGLKNSWDAKRRAQEKRAMPAWANSFFIDEAFRLAKLRERICGGKWHVDHIVPLQHKLVCGLHVERNFQVIPARDNFQKSNVTWPDMP